MRRTIQPDFRPDYFELDYEHPLARGLVFAGLGAHAGALRYDDASLHKRTCVLAASAGDVVATWESDLGRRYVEFDGTDENVNCGTDGIYSAKGTMAAWCRTTDATTTQGIVSCGYQSTQFWRLSVISDEFSVLVRQAGVNRILLTGGTPPDNEWFHVAVTQDGGGPKLYVNGKEETLSGTGPTEAYWWQYLTSNHLWAVGRIYYSGSWSAPWDGGIADPMLWERALTTSEIRALADPGNVMLSGLIQPPVRRWWPVGAAGGGTSTTPTPVSATWSAVTPTTTTNAVVSPTSAVWSAVTPSTTVSVSTTPDSAAWSAVTPTVSISTTPTPASATWSAVTPTVTGATTTEPTPVSATWSAVTPSTTTAVSTTAASAAWSAVTPTTAIGTITQPSPVSATWSALAPTVSLALSTTPASATWSVVTPSVQYVGQTTPDGLDYSAHDTRPHYAANDTRPHYSVGG